MSNTKEKTLNILPKTISRKTWVPFTILIIGIVLSITAAIYTKKDLENISKREFSLVCDEIKAKIHSRLHAHAQLLRSGTSFFAAADSVSRKDWQVFIENSELNKNLPGIQGVGFSLIIKKAELQKHIRNIRAEGFPNYKVYPSGERDIYTSIIFLEPFSGKNLRAFGYDMYSEPTRRKAMTQACDHDIAALSGKVVLVQEAEKKPQAGTLMYVPVYRNDLPANTIKERRAAILGWVYSPYRMNDLMQGILGPWNKRDHNSILLQIYDNDNTSQNSLLFESRGKDTLTHNESSAHSITTPIIFNEKKWTLRFSRLSEPLFYFEREVLIVLFSGLTISFLLFYLLQAFFHLHIKARQIAEKLTSRIKESEANFINLANSGITLVWKSGLDKECYYFNEVWLEFTGRTIEQERGNGWAEGVHPDDLQRCLDIYISAFDKRDKFSMDYRLRHFDGEYRWIVDDGCPIYGSKNEFIGYVGQCYDITERKLLEASLKEKNAKIELQNEELQKLNSVKDKFFSIIAHDLKSPLNAIMSFSEMLIEQINEKDYEEIEKHADFIQQSTKRTIDLLMNLLEWTKSQTGRIEFNPELFEIAAFINKTTLIYDDIAGQKSITIKKVLPESKLIFADKAMISTILRNLISNAIKFTMPGGEIIVSASEKQNEILFSVKDTGVGITKNSIEKLFRLDQSFSTSGTNKEKGTGLGLILSKEFVEKQNGKIWVESEEKIGSTFYFSLPYGMENSPA